MRVLIAPDKFKGSLTAAEVADHLATGLAEAGANTRTLPLADGGDGSVAAALASGFHPLPVDVHGAAGEHIAVWSPSMTTPRSSKSPTPADWQRCPAAMLAPMAASSYGFGEAIRAALTLSRQRLVLALGGSASTDGGIGMLAAWATASSTAPVSCWPPPPRTWTSSTASTLSTPSISAESSSSSPVMSPARCSGSPAPPPYSAPKRAPPQPKSPNSTPAWRTSSLHSADRVSTIAETFARACGSGAAGGIGFAAMLLGATTASGAEYFLDLLNFDQLVADADLVITGEGRLDNQTLQGKLPAVVALRAAPTRSSQS